MDFKRNSLSILCVSLIFTCAAFTAPIDRSSRSKSFKKDRKNSHSLIIAPTTLQSSSSSLVSTYSSLDCFHTPFDFLPTYFPTVSLVEKDTLSEITLIETKTETTKEITAQNSEENFNENEQNDILALLDGEADQKTTQNELELDEEDIDFSSNLIITPQLIEKVANRENFVTSLVDIAIAQEGVPYVHGGKSPRGFDCSGFVSYVYSRFKISLPASSSSYDNVGKKVKLENAQVGDVICFTGRNSRSGRTGHVGIVVENNPNEPLKFIHAASGSRRQITYSTMESAYYKARFRSVRRITAPVLENILETESAE